MTTGFALMRETKTLLVRRHYAMDVQKIYDERGWWKWTVEDGDSLFRNKFINVNRPASSDLVMALQRPKIKGIVLA